MLSYLIVSYWVYVPTQNLENTKKYAFVQQNSYSNISIIQTPSFNINEYSMMMTLANTGAFG